MELFPTRKKGPVLIEDTIGQFTSIVFKLQQGTQECEEAIIENDNKIQQLVSQNADYRHASTKAIKVINGIEMLLNGGEIPSRTEEQDEDSGGTNKG